MVGNVTRGASTRKKTPTKKAEEATSTAPRDSAAKDDGKQGQAGKSQARQHHPLERVMEGMNPRSLLTGLYGARGERIRHIVRNGALSMPKASLDLMAEFEESSESWRGPQPPSKKKMRRTYPLPGLDSVVRPSMDKNLYKIKVTDISQKQAPNANDPTQPPTWKTTASNRVIKMKAMQSNMDETERIRGGGDDGPTPAEGQYTAPNPTESASGAAPGAGNEPAAATNRSSSQAQSNPPVPNPISATSNAPSPAPLLAPTSSSQAPAPAAELPSDTPVQGNNETSPAATALSTSSNPALASSEAALNSQVPTTTSVSAITAPAASQPTSAPAPAQSTEAASAQATGPVSAAGASINNVQIPVSAQATGAPTGQASAPSPEPSAPAGQTSATAPAASASQGQTPAPAPIVAAAPSAPIQKTETPITQPAALPPAPSAPAGEAPGLTTAASTSSAHAPAPAQKAAAAPSTHSATQASSSSQQVAIPIPVATTSSSATAPTQAATSKVIPLVKKPSPQWEQHVPSANDENLTDPQAKTQKPDWYDPKNVSSLEKALLPEWFDGSAPHRTVESYIKARETMIHISDKLGNRYVTSTLARRSLPGDVGSLHRLHQFLTNYMWINEDARNDSTPTAPSLQQPPQLVDVRGIWTDKRRGDLVHAVVEVSQQNKKQKTKDTMEIDGVQNNKNTFVPIDWDAIAEKMGASPVECEREFLAMPLDGSAAPVSSSTERPITPDTTTASESKAPQNSMLQEEFLKVMLDQSSPRVISAVTKAALQATGDDLNAAQNAARIGLVSSQAVKAAQGHEETVARLLSEVIDQRMQKLECRMALMDDLEGMLEAERVALELERRDLYTTRCRDWFGGA